ncbi:hypothetical protein DMB95_08275 [Campylobacter sp. MIT 12-8780]|uniref:hypothetical protein n=2 Tax=Campylobacter TaxID=194 RepID=UPI0010FA491B|nr:MULTISPECIES: hypothetical protein [unclassified Campylobacter]NDJ27408.1 hypothetical protein [Campylobacter sp. MIT 19-121]TKX28537.1 hypothetical protein CQA38_07625 [Campylobacter sp. MIT 12-5580]TQR40201.1 hypothetical protein DMB95_08275 [Campylobacter sp. MIT 12-8780]
MRPMPENFVAFFTVCGFFIGLAFSVVSIEGAFEIVIFTCLITFAFYVLVHISIMNFIDVTKIGGRVFNKAQYEETSNTIINDLAIREKKMEHLLEKLNEERVELKKNEAKERRKNAKKRPA